MASIPAVVGIMVDAHSKTMIVELADGSRGTFTGFDVQRLGSSWTGVLAKGDDWFVDTGPSRRKHNRIRLDLTIDITDARIEIEHPPVIDVEPIEDDFEVRSIQLEATNGQ